LFWWERMLFAGVYCSLTCWMVGSEITEVLGRCV
jgi:hypothetical protein